MCSLSFRFAFVAFRRESFYFFFSDILKIESRYLLIPVSLVFRHFFFLLTLFRLSADASIHFILRAFLYYFCITSFYFILLCNQHNLDMDWFLSIAVDNGVHSNHIHFLFGRTLSHSVRCFRSIFFFFARFNRTHSNLLFTLSQPCHFLVLCKFQLFDKHLSSRSSNLSCGTST